ncbi:sporulation protein [Staphylococcus simulans]|nr:sporulation protein [Staphylococcus simulans]
MNHLRENRITGGKIMRRTITVGHGIGKIKPNELVSRAASGDIIVFEKSSEPYVIKKGLTVPSGAEITFKSNGDPKETVIDSAFKIEGNVSFQNVTIDLQADNNIQVSNGSKVDFDNVIIKNNSTNAAIYSVNSKVILKRMNFISDKKESGILIDNYSEAKIEDSFILGLGVRNNSYIVINNSKIINALVMYNHAELNAKNLYIDYENAWLPLSLICNSKLNIDNLHLIGEGGNELKVLENSTATIGSISSTNIPRFNIDNTSTLDTQANFEATNEVSTLEVEQPLNTQQTEEQEISQAQPQSLSEQTNPQAMAKQSLEELNALIGLENVKRTVNMFINNVKINQIKKENGMYYDKISLHSVFLGNPGTGKTTVARLLGKVLYYNGVIKTDNFVEVSRNQLVSSYVGKTAEQTEQILESSKGGILFIDEAYTLYEESGINPGQEAVDTILKYMEDYRDEIMIIFAGYTNEMYDFFNMNPGLKSRVQHQFMFDDYNDQQMIEIGESILNKQGLIYNPELYRKQMTKLLHQSNDNSNARWVRNFNEKLVMIQNSRLANENALNQDALRQIIDEDILQMSGKDNEQETLDNLLEELHSLVGLNNVKNFVSKLVKEAKANKMFEEKGLSLEKPTYHMVFTGPPGTGKTTIARLIAKIFYNLDILAEDKVVEVDRQNLVGAYIGHTEKNTAKAVDQAMGGVLFVDEAYQLASGSENDFGHLAVETLITSLENYRDKFIAIFAGYTNDMERFLNENEGLKSRIPYTIEFPAYSSEEVAEIVYRILNKDWNFDKDYLLQSVSQAYENQSEDLKANGRWARNTAQKILSNHKAYVVEHVDELTDITEINNETILNTLNEE